MIKASSGHIRFRHLPLAAAAVIVLCFSAFGITLDAYKAKVEEARRQAVLTEIALADDSSSDNLQQARALVDHINSKFPSTESVEWPGGAAETSNEWLLVRANAIDKETKIESKAAIVSEIREYLSAILFKIEELGNAAEAGRTKDEDKQKLGEILRREEYQKPEPKKESAVQRWIREFLEWLEGLFPKQKGQSNFEGLPALAKVLQVILFVALGGLLLFLVYKLVPLIFPTIGTARKAKKKSRVILGEHIAEEETAIDLFAEAERMAREGNLRGAIRKGYIALLCDLSDRRIIGLARNKTNRDYLRDLKSRRDLHPRVKSMTETFERHWYGFQNSSEADWVSFREEYDQAIRNA